MVLLPYEAMLMSAALTSGVATISYSEKRDDSYHKVVHPGSMIIGSLLVALFGGQFSAYSLLFTSIAFVCVVASAD